MDISVTSDNLLEELTLKLGLCDVDTIYHCLRVGNLARVCMEEYIRLYSPELDYTPKMLGWAALIHDIGKQKVPPNVLFKTTGLTNEEFEEIHNHVFYGEDILKEFAGEEYPVLRRLVTETITCHHERADGNGYPTHLTEEDIPLSAQIVSLVDCFDALVGARAYKPPMEVDVAEALIRDGKCGRFSEKILACLPSIMNL